MIEEIMILSVFDGEKNIETSNRAKVWFDEDGRQYTTPPEKGEYTIEDPEGLIDMGDVSKIAHSDPFWIRCGWEWNPFHPHRDLTALRREFAARYDL